MVARPPRSTLFPTRRSSDLRLREFGWIASLLTILCLPPYQLLRRAQIGEHTSELQSQSNVVCRLLLEKKRRWWLAVVRAAGWLFACGELVTAVGDGSR